MSTVTSPHYRRRDKTGQHYFVPAPDLGRRVCGRPGCTALQDNAIHRVPETQPPPPVVDLPPTPPRYEIDQED